MQKNKDSDYSSRFNNSLGVNLGGGFPMIEMIGNRRVTVEGSTGVLLYERENIKINTNKMVLSFCGRGLCVRCISNSCVEIEGFITGIEFMN